MYYSQCKTTTTTTPYVSAAPELQEDAQFLIHSSFGPTRASLAELGTKGGSDIEKWGVGSSQGQIGINTEGHDTLQRMFDFLSGALF